MLMNGLKEYSRQHIRYVMIEYSLNGKYTAIIIETNDVGALGWIG